MGNLRTKYGDDVVLNSSCRFWHQRKFEWGVDHRAQSKSRIGPVPFSTSVLRVQWPQISNRFPIIGLDRGYSIPFFVHPVQRFNLRFGSVYNFKFLRGPKGIHCCTRWKLWVSKLPGSNMNYVHYDRTFSCKKRGRQERKYDLQLPSFGKKVSLHSTCSTCIL